MTKSQIPNPKQSLPAGRQVQNSNFQSPKLVIGHWSLVIIWLLVIGCWLFPVSANALNNPEQKVAEVIKGYILTKYPDWSRDEIRLTFKFAEKTFADVGKLTEDTRFRVLEIYPEFKPVGNVVLPIEIQNGENIQKILLRAKVEVLKRVAAAAKRIKKGKVLEASDLKLEERDIALLPQKYFVELYALVGKEAKITIPANSTLFEWMLGDLPLIRRGSEVTILVAEPGFTIKTKGQALEDGYRDAEIKVKRAESKKTIIGKVLSPTEVEVKL